MSGDPTPVDIHIQHPPGWAYETCSTPGLDTEADTPCRTVANAGFTRLIRPCARVDGQPRRTSFSSQLMHVLDLPGMTLVTHLVSYIIISSDMYAPAALIPGRKDDQCSKRYNDILDPSAKNRLSDWTAQEDNLLRQGVASLGHRWAAISSRIPGRPPLTCRNRWRTLSRQSHSRQAQSKSQGTTPSSSASQMSPMDSGVSPAPQNLNLDLESASASAAEQIMSFSAIEAEAGRDQTGPSFLDSAFYETFAGPSPPSLHDTDTGENTEKENGTGVASDSVLLGDLSTGFSDQTQTAPKQWPQQPRALHTRHRQDSTTGAIMPSPSSWSSMSSMVATGTSPPTDQNLWLGATAGGSSTTAPSSAPKNWGIPDESLLQSYTESFQLPQTTQQTVHHHHHHHVHHHFHHYHHYSAGDQWRQLERQSEAEAMQSHLRNENRQPNSG
ncbi:BAS1-transcription factor [Fusarium albosuccineum]|uniref:BAS1-transcription factor n=1 Tax=Fusarium albosuccineum TaxID=1237068 RepID=A0A8H4LEB9_9HYPO|nr:BAS1-transcription factor [Fusarium albosuccineum]